MLAVRHLVAQEMRPRPFRASGEDVLLKVAKAPGGAKRQSSLRRGEGVEVPIPREGPSGIVHALDESSDEGIHRGDDNIPGAPRGPSRTGRQAGVPPGERASPPPPPRATMVVGEMGSPPFPHEEPF